MAYSPVLIVLAMACGALAEEERYTADWASLARHRDPEWLADAKFGIYTHWGPVTLGMKDAPHAYGWYARNLYKEQLAEFAFHRETWGDQKEFGFKDLIPLFTAPDFDAGEWADLFKKSGARFAGPVAVHHDNFCLWDSEVTRWNSMDMGPKRDITGELEKAIRERGMKFITTFHHPFTWSFLKDAVKYDGADPQYADLYGPPGEIRQGPPTEEYGKGVVAKVDEVVEKYRPDLIWFDFGFGRTLPEPFRKEIFAKYYDWAEKDGREVGLIHKHWEIHQHSGIVDFERGRVDFMTDFTWMTDSSTGPWFHNKNSKYRSSDEIIDTLVDIVSKNGVLLLNVGPDYRGKIPPQSVAILKELGAWLEVNGRGIYETRPWTIFGEGPTRVGKGKFSEKNEDKYGAADIRFTRSKDGKTVYVFVLGKPKGDLTVKSIALDDPKAGTARLLGVEGTVVVKRNADGHLVIPAASCAGARFESALCFELRGFDLKLHPEAPKSPRTVRRGDIKSAKEQRDINDPRNAGEG